jgi:uroporphyrinogen III methyltransferase/synthase
LVLTSGNALRALMDAGATADQPWPLIAAIGAATAQRCAEVGLATAFIPRHTTAEGLVAEWVPQLSPQARVLLPQAANARPVVANALRASHISVDVVTAYRTVPPATATDLESQAINAVTVASSATVDRLLAQVPRSRLDGAVWVAIGPAPAQRCRDHGLGPVVVADEATDDGLVQAVSRATPPH